MAWWRGAILFCLGCSFEPAGLEGRPGPCLEGFAEVRGLCYLTDAGAVDGGARDVRRQPDVDPRSDARGRPDVVDFPDSSRPSPDASMLDASLDVIGDCRCDGLDLVRCSPCEGGIHRYCDEDGIVQVGSSCTRGTVATCDDDREVFGECLSGCGNANGWGCDFVPGLLSGEPPPFADTGELRGDELVVNVSRGTLVLDGRPAMGILESLGPSGVIIHVSVLDVATIRVDDGGSVAIRASDTIRIRGDLDFSAVGSVPGPGGFAMDGPMDACGGGAEGGGPGGGGGASFSIVGPRAGGGGGGFGTSGGDGGGSFGMSCAGSSRGGDAQDVSFMGGSAGGGSRDLEGGLGDVRGGGGGGAIYLSARVAIFVDGDIDVSGGGGGGGRIVAGAGGGSGGLIYIESPILVSSGVALIANGGGGGASTRSGSPRDGEDGGDGVFAGDGASGESDGGDGSDEDGEAQVGEGSFSSGGGGGGGGAGFIIIRTGNGVPIDDVETSPGIDSPSTRWQPLP